MSGWVKLYRQIDESELMDLTPTAREMFLYFIRKVNHSDSALNGLKRGVGIFTYPQIIEALSWRQGCVKKTYSKDQIYKGLGSLVVADCVAYTKTTRGIVLEVLNFHKFQGLDNHVDDTVDDKVAARLHGTINKNDKNIIYNKNNKSACAHTPASNFKEDQPSLSQFIHLVISDLNFLLDKNFNPYSAETSRLITERLAERCTLEKFYEVNRRWILRSYGEDWYVNLRPDNLYNHEFEKKLNFEVTFKSSKVFLTWTDDQKQEIADLTKKPEWGEPWTWYGTEQKNQLFKAMTKSWNDWRSTLDSLQGRMESTCA